MSPDDMKNLLLQVEAHVKSHNPPSETVDKMVAKIKFLRNLIDKKECTHMIQLISYVLYVSEIDIADKRRMQ